MKPCRKSVRNKMNTFGFVCTTYYLYSKLTSKRFNFLTCWSVRWFNSSAIHDRQTERKQNSWRLDSVTRYLGVSIKAKSGYRSLYSLIYLEVSLYSFLFGYDVFFFFTWFSRISFGFSSLFLFSWYDSLHHIHSTTTHGGD